MESASSFRAGNRALDDLPVNLLVPSCPLADAGSGPLAPLGAVLPLPGGGGGEDPHY